VFAAERKLPDEIQLGRSPVVRMKREDDMLAICGIYEVATRVKDLPNV